MAFEGNNRECPLPELSVYIDGELSVEDNSMIDKHLRTCRICAAELNLKKNLFRVLDASTSVVEFELPAGFSKTVAVNAESRVEGLRRGSERRNYFIIFGALLLLIFLALGRDSIRTFGFAAGFFDRVFVVFEIFGHLLYSIGIGAAVILRTFTHNVEINPFVLLVAIAIPILLVIFQSRWQRRSPGSGG